jgi:hypothetical protein
MVLAACANAKIDRCECQTNTKNARSLIAKATTKISGSELMTQILSVRACRRDRAGRLDHDGVRICDALSNVGTPRSIASLPPEVAQGGALHAARAMQFGVSRQDAFLIPFANFAEDLVRAAAW